MNEGLEVEMWIDTRCTRTTVIKKNLVPLKVLKAERWQARIANGKMLRS